MRQYNRDTPYTYEHRNSVARKGKPPSDLLAWFLGEYRGEMPDKIHTSDVWRDRVSPDEEQNGIKAVGGSLLGTPRTHDAFRQYIEGSPLATVIPEYDGHKDVQNCYASPLRAALARLAGRGPNSAPFPLMARMLHRLAVLDGDIDAALDSMLMWKRENGQVVVDEEATKSVRHLFFQTALKQLYVKWEPEPPARTVRTEAA